MINPNQPDYTNTPASDYRPTYFYKPRDYDLPFVSVITAFYNTNGIFQETVRSIQRMSFVHWEWIIVDDGSTNSESLAQLEWLQTWEPRVRLIHQANSGPAAARNHAAREARGRYLLQLDSDDLVEPTFVEKAIWVLETQPQFAACCAYNVTFGSQNLLWMHGFQEYERNLRENMITHQAVICRDAFLAAGGYDESIIHGHEDWDLWLNLAEAGYWGYTIPEHLTWYRNQIHSRRMETECVRSRVQAFHHWLHTKHSSLARNFPRPQWLPTIESSHAAVCETIPLPNLLAKPAHVTRVLFLVPWLTIGGADKFNLDLIRSLSKRGYEFTIVSTLRSTDPWLHEFSSLTPDIFRLHRFLHHSDYPRFLNYLIESRQVDLLLISNSECAYSLVPYLRASYPSLAILDYTHVEEEHWKNGGYPGISVRLGSQLDLRITCTRYLKKWMIAREAAPEHIQVCHANIDAAIWNPRNFNGLAIRQRLNIEPDIPIILFVGRLVKQKRPLVFAQIIQQLASRTPNFISLVIGAGEELPSLEAFVCKHHLERYVRFLGARSNQEVCELMASGDILLLPSQYEGLALVLYESMAMETVPVASNVGGHPELVTVESGFLISQSNHEIEDYVRALLQLLINPQLRHTMAQKARQRIVEHFDLPAMADGMEEAFCRARQLALVRPTGSEDMELARYTAHMAVEYMRMEELAELLWKERMSIASWKTARRIRQAILPINSLRYEVYKRFRSGLRWGKNIIAFALRRRATRIVVEPQMPLHLSLPQNDHTGQRDEQIPTPASGLK